MPINCAVQIRQNKRKSNMRKNIFLFKMLSVIVLGRASFSFGNIKICNFSGFLAELDRMNLEVREYLWSHPSQFSEDRRTAWKSNNSFERMPKSSQLQRWFDCAQIVPVKVKYFQTVPNETKSKFENWNRINMLKTHEIWIFWVLVWKSPCRQFDSVPRHQFTWKRIPEINSVSFFYTWQAVW